MLVGKVVGQEEEIKAQVYPSTNDTFEQVCNSYKPKPYLIGLLVNLKRISSHLEAGETQNLVE